MDVLCGTLMWTIQKPYFNANILQDFDQQHTRK